MPCSERVAKWTLTDMWYPPANIHTKGGSPRRGGDGQQIASHLRLMDYVFHRTHDPLFLVLPRECMVRGFGENAKQIGTRSTGLVLNNVPWFITTLQEFGDPQPDSQLVISLPKEVGMAPGDAAAAVVRVTNTGTTAITDLQASFQSRVDFRIGQAEERNTIAPGETIELTYQVAAPADVNSQCLCNRVAYGHWSAIYRRGQSVHFGHAPISILLKE